MSSAAVALYPAIGSGARVWAWISLGLWTIGLTVLYLPWGISSTGVALAAVGLAVGVLLSPPEYALGAVACAFVAASCRGLAEAFLSLRWVFLAAATVGFSLRLLLSGRTRGPRPTAFPYLLVLFAVISAAALMNSVATELSVLKLGAFFTVLFVAWRGAAEVVVAYGPSSPRRLAQGLLAYVLVVVVFSISVYFVSSAQVRGIGGRFVGHLRHPNVWGAFVVTILPWMACAIVQRSRQKGAGRALVTLGVLLTGYSLLLCGSRASLLGALVSLSVLCLIHADRRIAAVVLLVSVLVTARLLADPVLLPRLSREYLYKHEGSRPRADLLQSRLEPWKRARANFLDSPWMGLGFGVTSKAESSWELDVKSGAGSIETGSSFWSTLCQVGALGASPLFLAILLVLLRAGIFAWKVKDPRFTGIYASVMALVANAAFEGWLIAPGSFAGTYFWIQCFFLNAMVTRFRVAPAHSSPFAAPHLAEGWAPIHN